MGEGDNLIELNSIEVIIKEKDDGNFVLSLPISEVDSNSVLVNISEDGTLSLIFKSRDKALLQIYPKASEDALFVWYYTLNEKVKENCSATVEQSSIHISLERLEPNSKVAGSSVNHLPVLSSCRPKITDFSRTPMEKKPTCLVNPMTNSSSTSNLDFGTLGRGFAGLENLGNTCYMNSVLQGLVNTRECRDYFLDSRFDIDINRENPLGTGGDLAVAFASVCQKLWNAKFKSVDATFLKDVISRRSNQFYGYAQHDAQELMAFLVDGLHEDLNRVRKAPKSVTGGSGSNNNEVVADASWSSYKSRNDSMIVDIFQGQYKSKLVCPVCNKISITFDPFLYLSVPLPKKVRLIPVVYFSLDYNKKPVKYYVKISQDAKVEELKEIVASNVNVAFAKLIVFEVYRNKIHRFIGKGHSLESVEPNDTIFVFETCLEPEVCEPVVELSIIQRLMMPVPPKRCSFCNRERSLGGEKLKRCTKCFRVCYCDESCQKKHWSVHRSQCKVTNDLIGCPFLVTLPRSQCTYSKLCQIMEGYSRYSVDIFKPPLDVSSFSSEQIPTSPNREDVPPNFEDNVISSDVSAGLKQSEQQFPLFYITPVNQSGITLPPPKGKRLEDKKDEILDLSLYTHLAMDWRNSERMKNYVLVETKTLEVECFENESERREELNSTTLDQCLNLFCASETLSPEEAWFCSKCQRNQQATKQMSIRRTPHTLIIQLKRFLFKNSIWREKIDKMVKYPIRGLDLTPYCCPTTPGEKTAPPPIYDLFAVIQHTGNIISGHYTTTARLLGKDSNETEIGWRLFDDRHVSLIPESEIVSRYAYVLFYRRRDFTFTLFKSPSATVSAAVGTACVEATQLSTDKKENETSDVEDAVSINV